LLRNFINKEEKGLLRMEMCKHYTSHSRLAQLASERIILTSATRSASRDADLERRLRSAGQTRSSRPGH
jgi:hypothetical protein